MMLTDTSINAIDEHEAILLLRKAVEERGSDFRYGDRYPESVRYEEGHKTLDCSYVVDGEPACLVGLALSYRVDLEELEELPQMSSDAVHLFVVAQLAQDKNATWGAALASAESQYKKDGS